MLERKNPLERRSLQNPLFYPHRKGDRIVNLKTEQEGVIVDDYELINSLSPYVTVKFEDGIQKQHIMDIANVGNIYGR